jgi:hypothetical protein
MDDNGPQHDHDDFERRLYQVLALLERAGEQQRAAAETLTQAAELEQRINQAIQAAGAQAAARIADETRSAIDAAVSSSAQTMRQAARSAVAAAENLRFPWSFNLVVILLAGLLSGSFAFWGCAREAAIWPNREHHRTGNDRIASSYSPETSVRAKSR